MSLKSFSLNKGYTAQTNLENARFGKYQLFVQADPQLLDLYEDTDSQLFFSGSDYFNFDFTPYIRFLTTTEAEIFTFMHIHKKSQTEVASIFHVKQPGIFYKYQKIVKKLYFYVLMEQFNLPQILGDLGCTRFEISLLRSWFYDFSHAYVLNKYKLKKYIVLNLIKRIVTKAEEQAKSDPMFLKNWVLILFALEFAKQDFRVRVSQKHTFLEEK